MIKAQHSNFAHFIFKLYLKRLVKSSFHSFRLVGEIPNINNSLPLIITPNHSTWWDGFFVYLLNEQFFMRKFYLLMLEKQLNKYKFFSKLGAFSIEQSAPKKVLESIHYSAGILNHDSVFFIFPQGELLPNNIRPIRFQKGLKKIIEIYGKKLTILPMAMKAELLGEQKPDVLFSFGEEHICDAASFKGITSLAEEVEELLDGIEESILTGRKTEEIFKGGESVSSKSVRFFKK